MPQQRACLSYIAYICCTTGGRRNHTPREVSSTFETPLVWVGSSSTAYQFTRSAHWIMRGVTPPLGAVSAVILSKLLVDYVVRTDDPY